MKRIHGWILLAGLSGAALDGCVLLVGTAAVGGAVAASAGAGGRVGTEPARAPVPALVEGKAVPSAVRRPVERGTPARPE